MFTRILDVLISSISSKSYHSNVYAISRTLLAVGLILTLCFNNSDIFLPKKGGDFINQLIFHFDAFHNFNCFILLGLENFDTSKWLAILILLFVVIGWRPRITGILHWWITYSFFTISVGIDGGDHIAAILTLFFIPITVLDKRKNHWHKDMSVLNEKKNAYTSIFLFFIFLLIKIQVAGIYLHAAIGKLFSDEWVNGTAVYYWFNHSFFSMPNWSRPLLSIFLENSFFVSTLTWGVIMFELLLFCGLFMSSKRKIILLLLGLLFHFGILLLHGLFSFYFSISAALIIYLYPVQENFTWENAKRLIL